MRSDAALILLYLGFVVDIDFVASANDDGTVTIEWRSAQPQPTEAELDSAAEAAHVAAERAAILPVSAAQIRLALSQTGLRSAVEQAVLAAGQQDLSDWWEFSTLYHRDHPLVVGMCATLGVSPAQADDLWRLAATIK